MEAKVIDYTDIRIGQWADYLHWDLREIMILRMFARSRRIKPRRRPKFCTRDMRYAGRVMGKG